MRIFGLAFILLGLFVSAAGAHRPPDPGDYLLRAVKAAVDSGRADDPRQIAALLHLKLDRTRLNLGPPGACPMGAHQFEDDYAAAGNSWFHSLPTGKKHMRLANIVGDLGFPGYKTVGDPEFKYTIHSDDFGTTGCAGPGLGLVRASIAFNNIPAYACIGIAQFVSLFPKTVLIETELPSNVAYFQYLAIGKYSIPAVLPYVDARRPYSVPVSGDVRVNRRIPYEYIDFEMTPGPLDNQPPCLLNMSLEAGYNYGPLHKPDIGRSVPANPAGADCPASPKPLDRAFCEATLNFSARNNLRIVFNQSLTGLPQPEQIAARQAQAAWSKQLDRECTATFQKAIFVDFRCATTAINQRVSALLSKLNAPPTSFPSGFLMYRTGDDCANEVSRIAAAICQAGDARGASADFRQVYNDYLAHLDTEERTRFLASQRAWRQYLDEICAAKFDNRAFVDFGCVDKTIHARAYLLAERLSAPATNYDGKYTIRGSAMPWFRLGGWNDTLDFDTPDGTGPTVLTLAGLHARPGQRLTIKYLSGAITDAHGKTLTGQGGLWNAAVSAEHGFVVRRTGPSMPALIGTFTDSVGHIIPGWQITNGNDFFAIPPAGATETIPAGATQLQLGINRGSFSQNFGGLIVSVTVSDAN